MLKFVHHIEYVVHDRDAMVEYFEKTFGMKPDQMEVNARGREAHFNVGHTQIQIFEPADPTTVKAKHLAAYGPGVSHVGWAVDDIQKAAQELQAKGVKIRPETMGTTDADKVHKPASPSHTYRTLNTDPSSSLGVSFQLIGK